MFKKLFIMAAASFIFTVIFSLFNNFEIAAAKISVLSGQYASIEHKLMALSYFMGASLWFLIPGLICTVISVKNKGKINLLIMLGVVIPTTGLLMYSFLNTIIGPTLIVLTMWIMGFITVTSLINGFRFEKVDYTKYNKARRGM